MLIHFEQLFGGLLARVQVNLLLIQIISTADCSCGHCERSEGAEGVLAWHRETPPTCVYGILRPLLKFLKMVVEISDINQFF